MHNNIIFLILFHLTGNFSSCIDAEISLSFHLYICCCKRNIPVNTKNSRTKDFLVLLFVHYVCKYSIISFYLFYVMVFDAEV